MKNNKESVDIICSKFNQSFLFNQNSLMHLGTFGINIIMTTRVEYGRRGLDVLVFMYRGNIIGEYIFLDDVLTASDRDKVSHKYSRMSLFKKYFKDEEIDYIKVHKDILKVIERHSRYYYHRKYKRRYETLVALDYYNRLYGTDY